MMAGEGRVEFKGTSVQHHHYCAGDFIYVPAGTPHRILPTTESIRYRYKLSESKLEGVAWYCEECGTEIHREVWELGEAQPQDGCLRACEAFNATASYRSCPDCEATHPQIDTQGTRWAKLANADRA